MIRYRYNRQCTPPAPFVHVRVGCPQTRRETDNVAAQLDTAADRTVIPAQVAEQLGLVPLREVQVEGFGGHVAVSPTFLVVISLHELPSIRLEVLAEPRGPYVILGRDVLNQFRILLDGPQLALEIGP